MCFALYLLDMIYSLSGTVVHVGDDFVVIETAGIGFRVRALPSLLASVHVGDSRSVICFTQPETFDLYGFAHADELDIFTLLNSVSGIGPRIASKIMGAVPVATLRAYISSGNKESLVRACAVSAKTASKIILELREKVGAGRGEESMHADDGDVADALQALGYGRKDIADALDHVDASVEGLEKRTKAALKYLGARRKAGGR